MLSELKKEYGEHLEVYVYNDYKPFTSMHPEYVTYVDDDWVFEHDFEHIYYLNMSGKEYLERWDITGDVNWVEPEDEMLLVFIDKNEYEEYCETHSC